MNRYETICGTCNEEHLLSKSYNHNFAARHTKKPLAQRFYLKCFDHDDRWYLFLGNEEMEAQGKGLLVHSFGYRSIAELNLKEYTAQFNRIVEAENG